MSSPIVRRSLEADGVRISYLTVDVVSPSDTLLLIHGAGVSARTWVQQLRGLADVVRPIAIDLPGRRESDAASDPTLATYAELIYEALRRLHSGPAFVAGHSLGGAVAQVLAERHPEVVKGLVLISTCAKMPRVDATTRALAAVPWPFRRTVLQWAARRTLLAPSAPADAVRLTLDEIRECRVSTIQSDVAIGRAIDVEDPAALAAARRADRRIPAADRAVRRPHAAPGGAGDRESRDRRLCPRPRARGRGAGRVVGSVETVRPALRRSAARQPPLALGSRDVMRVA